ncbi:MAG TPA: hypothetical protein VFQ61_39565 [Polyangiaceae bacterium]|nr:hypothetical protein [Polyangiaceae bacterium]
MKQSLFVVVAAGLLLACQGPSPSSVHRNWSGVTTVELLAQVPPCTLLRRGAVYYVSAEDKLLYCDGTRYQELDLRQADGAAGESWVVQILPANTVDCPNGGAQMSVGPDADGDGVPDVVRETAVTCNGASAVGGPPVTRSVEEPPGTNCADGGQKLELGGDVNGNGALEESEVSSVQYVCSFLRIWYSDFRAQNNADAEALRGYSTVLGDLEIGPNITDLTPLQDLTGIAGTLRLEATSLTSLEALHHLSNIGGDFVLWNTAALTSLNGLGSLTRLGGSLSIRYNSGLARLTGLGPLMEIRGRLEVQDNPLLASLEGLDRVTRVGVDLSLRAGPAMQNLRGLGALASVEGSVSVYGSGLIDLDGLQSLTRIGGSFSANGDRLESLFGTEHLTEIGGAFHVPSSPIRRLARWDSLEHIGGDLVVEGRTGTTDLDGFNHLKTIGGSLHVYFSPLTGLNGIQSLESIEGALEVRSTPIADLGALGSLRTVKGTLSLVDTRLVSLTGLALTSIGGIYVASNPELADISALDSGGPLDLGEDLVLVLNDKLQSLHGLEAIRSVARDVYLSGSFANIDALEGLTRVGNDFVFSNVNIDDLEGLRNLASVGGDIKTLPPVTTLEGLRELREVGGEFLVYGTRATTLNGLQNLRSAGSLRIGRNPELTQIDALSQLTEVSGTLEVFSNPALIQVDGLRNVSTVGSVDISGNASLANLLGLGGIQRIPFNFALTYNAALQTTAGLENLTEVGRQLRITGNSLLLRLRGFSALERVGELLYIADNPKLASCEAEWLRDTVAARRGLGGSFLSGNTGTLTCP